MRFAFGRACISVGVYMRIAFSRLPGIVEQSASEIRTIILLDFILHLHFGRPERSHWTQFSNRFMP